MTNDEYRKAKGLNYSLLKQFNVSPDHALMEFKGNRNTMLGNAFEDLLHEKAGLFNNFTKNYTYLSKKINRRTTAGKEEYKQFELESEGKEVLTIEEYDMLHIMTNNMLNLVFEKHTIRELFKNAVVEAPIFWESRGIKKKAKVDFLLEAGNKIFPCDFKTYGKELSGFRYAIKDGYFIQDIHYCEGLEFAFPDKAVQPMTFLVASKQKPFLSQAWQISERTRENCEIAYLEIVDKFVKWDKQGRPAKGFIQEIGQADFYI